MSPQLSTVLPRYGHVRVLTVLFVVWKLLLLCVAVLSPGAGYDTSTGLLFSSASPDVQHTTRPLQHLTSKLVSWDALYFVSTSSRGYLFEQEWAFGWGFTQTCALASRVLSKLLPEPGLQSAALTAIVIAHVAHLLSVLILFQLGKHVFPYAKHKRDNAAFLAACLHIISPAGLFLSAPYTESLFSCLNFAGMLFYARAVAPKPGQQHRHISYADIMLSGVCFALASTVRGNGMLSGAIYLAHIVTLLPAFPRVDAIKSMIALGVSGLLVALGVLLPQYIAYQDYCTGASTPAVRPWCSNIPPSIYTFVQKRYWNNGFLRYWTLSNVPLFLIALPLLVVLFLTGFLASMGATRTIDSSVAGTSQQPSKGTDPQIDARRLQHYTVCMRNLAVPQLMLAALVLANSHVQIINRISSGYPTWYLVLAAFMTRDASSSKDTKQSQGLVEKASSVLESKTVQQWIVRSMIIYSVIQGVLYASFLPPA